MAQASLVVAVLLLALIANHIDCTSTNIQIEYNCKGATYEKDSFVEFAKYCAPVGWKDFFGHVAVKEAIKKADKIRQLYTAKQGYHIEPPMHLMFEAFKRVRPQDVKVVILGQDPTPQEGKATGKAFCVKDPRTVGSVMNVLLEVAYEGWSVDLDNGDLSKWEGQGVLLLNSALTIGKITYENLWTKKMKTKEVTHIRYWSQFTTLLINYINNLPKPSVWMLWGKAAKNHKSYITKGYILTGGHPSPLGGVGGKNTFFAGSYFYCANVFLAKTRGVCIDWGLRVGDKGRYEVNNKLAPCPPSYKYNIY